jgi:hypothetical protein
VSPVPAIVAAGEGRASRAVHGENKAFLELAGRPLVARVVAALQRVPEVSEVWVVGPPARLEQALGAEALRAELRKPLTIVPQFRNLLENAWETYRRLLPGAGPEGRDPATPEEEALPVLYLSADLPFATPQEISDFVTKSLETDCDYALGLVTEASMAEFYPEAPDGPGIRMAYFNMREGRFRQSNLHLVRPARLGNRRYIQEMYEHRYQKRLRHAVALAWRIVSARGGGLRMLWYYALMHLAAVADRRGLRRTADRLRSFVSLAKAEAACSRLLRTRFRFVVTEVGGCAVDIDNEEDFDASVACFGRWSAGQARRAEALLGPLPLPERAGGAAPAARVWPRRAAG